MKFVRNTRISSGVTLTNWVGRLSDQLKIRKVNHFLGGFLSSKLHESFWIWWITTRQVISKKGLEPSPKPNPKYIPPPLGLLIRSNQPGQIGLTDKWPSSQQNIFLWFFPFSQTHLVDNLLLLHVVKCLRGHRINNSLTFLAEYYISTTTSANYLGKYCVCFFRHLNVKTSSIWRWQFIF